MSTRLPVLLVLILMLSGSSGVPRIVRDNTITFVPEQNVRIKFAVLDGRVKETITLLAPPASNVFTFDLSTVGLSMQQASDGYHFYSAANEEVFMMPSPTIESQIGRASCRERV